MKGRRRASSSAMKRRDSPVFLNSRAHPLPLQGSSGLRAVFLSPRFESETRAGTCCPCDRSTIRHSRRAPAPNSLPTTLTGWLGIKTVTVSSPPSLKWISYQELYVCLCFLPGTAGIQSDATSVIILINRIMILPSAKCQRETTS